MASSTPALTRGPARSSALPVSGSRTRSPSSTPAVCPPKECPATAIRPWSTRPASPGTCPTSTSS
ncbi:hypothetical protein [Streptomyces koyangensis]